MVIEKVVTIVAMYVLNFLLAHKFIKRYAPENIVIIAISSFAFGSYLAFVVNNVYIPIMIQNLLFILMFGLPCIFVMLQYNDIILSRKILYYKMKLNMYVEEYEKAKKILFKLIDQIGRKADYYYLLGVCYKHLDDFVNSRDSFALAVELDKRNYLSYYELGCILDETNKKDTAIIMFNNALRIKPDFYEAAESLGITYTSQARYEEALKVYKNALEYHPQSFEIYYNIAMIELEIGDYDNAEKSFEKAANLKSKLYSAYYNIGCINYLKGDYVRAIEFFKLARSSTVYGGRAYYKLATVYAATREYEKSMSCLEYAFQIDSRYIKDAKEELIFENIKDRIISFEKDVIQIEEKKRDKNDYMKELEYTSKKKVVLENKIADDLKKEKNEMTLENKG
ncbi:MAG: tetratricopeptide repeat protein [Clostridia bacterium]